MNSLNDQTRARLEELHALPVGSVISEDYHDGNGASLYRKQQYDGVGDWMVYESETPEFELIQMMGTEPLATTSLEMASIEPKFLTIVSRGESVEAAA